MRVIREGSAHVHWPPATREAAVHGPSQIIFPTGLVWLAFAFATYTLIHVSYSSLRPSRESHPPASLLFNTAPDDNLHIRRRRLLCVHLHIPVPRHQLSPHRRLCHDRQHWALLHVHRVVLTLRERSCMDGGDDGAVRRIQGGYGAISVSLSLCLLKG